MVRARLFNYICIRELYGIRILYVCIEYICQQSAW